MANTHLKRAFSRDSYAQSPRTSAFADFLSDSSDDEDDDDAHSRATLRMQQQADDWFYEDSSFKGSTHTDKDDKNTQSFRLTMATPRGFETHSDHEWSRPTKVVKQEMAMKDVNFELGTAAKNKSFGYSSLTLKDGNSFTGRQSCGFPDDDSFYDEPKPSFSDEHSFGDDDSFMTVDTSFVYRPSLLDNDEVERPSKGIESYGSFGKQSALPRTSLSPSVLSITQESTDAKVPATPGDVDKKTPTNGFVGKTTGHRPKPAVTHGSGQGAADTNHAGHANGIVLVDHVRNEQQSHRLSNPFEERNALASTSSNSSSFTSIHSQASFFVDDTQQSFLSVISSSLGSRPSGEDSFTNVAILGDDVRDQNERHSSDIIPQDVCEFDSDSVSAVYPTASDAVDHSYSNLVDAVVRLDRKPVDHEGLYPINGNDNSANISANGTSLGSSLALSVASQSSAASDELPFISFSAAKPASSTESTKQQKQWKAMEPRSLIISSGRAGRQKAGFEAGEVVYRSIALPRGSGVKTAKPSKKSLSVVPSTYSTGATTFSSAALLAAVKMRDIHTDARSEADDVASGTLPQVAPPLKLIPVPGGSFVSNSDAESSSASRLAMLSGVSSTSSGDRLDFTGVYRGSIKSPMSSGNNGYPSKQNRSEAETVLLRSHQQSLGERKKDTVPFEYLGLRLERSKSDGRSMQREARRKVEDFFRDTHQRSVRDIDGHELHHVTSRKTRARTTVVQCVDNVVEGPRSFALHSTKAAEIIDLKNLHGDGQRRGWHSIPLTLQQEEESAKHRAMNLTIATTSSGTTATRSMPSDHTPIPRNYIKSPPMHAKANAANAERGERNGLLSVPSGPGEINVSRPNESSALSPLATSSATGAFGSGRSLVSSVGFGATARGFLWKSRSSFKASSDSLLDDSLVITQRSRIVDRVQRFSASILRHFVYTKDSHGQNGNVPVTSPRSQNTMPAALPRTYNHNGFYEIPFKVPDRNKPLRPREKLQLVESDRDWFRLWLILVACAVFGLCAGAILVRAVAFDASIFNLSAAEVHHRQESNGELVFGAAVRWILLPGHLFVRIWSAVVTPLLVCYVVNAISDLVGCADKATLVLSFRSIGYALMLAMLASVEGVVAMWMTHKFGWFRGSSSTTRSEASILSKAIGVNPLRKGAVGLQCTGDGEYLRRMGHDVFACSNASLLLPLHEEASTTSTDIADNTGPTVFVLQEVTRVFATPTSSTAYYPVSLGTGETTATSLLLSLSPDNLAARYTEVASDGVAPLSGLVVFALFLGYVCGKRILRLRRDAQAAMFESMEANDTHKACHYLVGLLVELQLALEWMVRPMERYLAPLGFFSLMLGHMVSHHREWRSLTSSMSSLLIGVFVAFMLHTVLVLPMLLKHFSSSRPRLHLLTTTRAFVPALLFAFTSDNVALSAPVTMQCYARVLTVTRSAAQVATAVTAAFTRNARALYLPLALLWLLETSLTEELELSVCDYLSIGVLSMLSCFCGGSSRLTLAMARTLWAIQTSNSARALPATMPLLVVCDVVLSRFASVVTVADHFVLTHLAAQHWGETVVHGPTNRLSNSSISSTSPLDDSQGYHPLSSAMMSSVCL